MPGDAFMVAGVLLGVLALPAAIDALSERRAPLPAAALALLAAGLVVIALRRSPDPPAFRAVPDAFIRVAAQLLN